MSYPKYRIRTDTWKHEVRFFAEVTHSFFGEWVPVKYAKRSDPTARGGPFPETYKTREEAAIAIDEYYLEKKEAAKYAPPKEYYEDYVPKGKVAK